MYCTYLTDGSLLSCYSYFLSLFSPMEIPGYLHMTFTWTDLHIVEVPSFYSGFQQLRFPSYVVMICLHNHIVHAGSKARELQIALSNVCVSLSSCLTVPLSLCDLTDCWICLVILCLGSLFCPPPPVFVSRFSCEVSVRHFVHYPARQTLAYVSKGCH